MKHQLDLFLYSRVFLFHFSCLKFSVALEEGGGGDAVASAGGGVVREAGAGQEPAAVREERQGALPLSLQPGHQEQVRGRAGAAAAAL